MPVNDIQSLQTYLRDSDVFAQFGLTRIGVFGSFARGEAYQDIDLLIEDTIPYKNLIAFQRLLQRDLQVPIDVMIRAYAEPIVLHRALKDIRYVTQA
jgi:predicted nucleotidyltransferase